MKKSRGRFIIVTTRATSPAGTPPRIHPPLGAISVLAEAKKGGYEVSLLDAAGEGLKRHFENPSYNPRTTEELDGVLYWKTGLSIEEIVTEVGKFKPDVIGLSCCTVVDRGEVAKTARALKKAYPTIPIILGGHEASQWYREILGDTKLPIEAIPEVDYVVVGAGQPVINPLLKFLLKGGNPPRGVAYRKNGKIIFRSLDVAEFDPNKYALPDYNFLPKLKIPNREKPIDIYSYIGNPHAGRIGIILKTEKPISYLPILTSYGCGFWCSFCDTTEIWGGLKRYSVENVMRIIDQFESLYGIDYIDFMDNNFAGGDKDSRTIAFQILSEISKRGYQIGFSNGLTFESMAREDFKLLRRFAEDGNVRHIPFPVENANDRILRMIRKPHNIKLVLKVLKFAREALPETNKEAFFIGGFPETDGQPAETPEELENTYRFIEKCLREKLLDQAIFLTLSPITRKYRLMWRSLFPMAPFEHCLFSRNTGIWPYPNELIEEMHQRVNRLNEALGRFITRKL